MRGEETMGTGARGDRSPVRGQEPSEGTGAWWEPEPSEGKGARCGARARRARSSVWGQEPSEGRGAQ